MVVCLWMGKTNTAKTPSSDFKVTTPENPLLLKQAVTRKWISIPYTNLQLNPYPNTQLDLFCSDNLSFLMHGCQYVTNQLHGSQYTTWTQTWEGCRLQSSSIHPNDEDHEVAWSQNPMVYKHSNFLKRMKN